jgi:hypothetical protein
MAIVSTAVAANSLKETLQDIIDDTTDGIGQNLIMSKCFDEDTMKDQFVDDQEYSGPGLAVEKPEGLEMSVGTIKEGITTRYLARTFALRLMVTEEAIEDVKYDRAINAQMRLKRAFFKTVEIDGAMVFARATNTSFVGGDNVPLASASHTLPQGGTFSNTLATPQSPSVAAVIVATTQMRKYPGHDGIVEGVEPVCVVHPVDQWASWEVTLRSTHKPDAGEFNAINVANSSLDIDLVPNKYWQNTTTNWCMRTSAEFGLRWFWRRKLRATTWVTNEQLIVNSAVSGRWTRGHSDARGILFSNA